MRDSSVMARVLNSFCVPATVSSLSIAEVKKKKKKTQKQLNLQKLQKG